MELGKRLGMIKKFLDRRNDRKNELEECDKKIALDPTNATLLYEKAELFNKHGKDKDAIKCYKQALDMEPKTASELCVKGINLTSNIKNKKVVLFFFNESLKIDPFNIETLRKKAQYLSQNGDDKDAIKCYDIILERHPKNGSIWELKGNTMIAIGNNGKSIKCYEKMIEIDNLSASTICNKANIICYKPKAEVELCNFLFGKAIKIDPNNMDILKQHLILLKYFNNLKEIINFLDKQIKQTPSQRFFWDEKISTLYENGKYKEVHKCCKQMLKVFSDDYDVLYMISETYFNIEKYKDVLEPVSRAIELKPEERDPLFLKGRSLFVLEKNDDAMSVFELLIKKNSEDYDAWVYKGKIFRRKKNFLRRQNKITEMKECYDHVIRCDPNNIPARIAYGVYYHYDKKDNVEGYKRYMEVIDIDPNDPIRSTIEEIKIDWKYEIERNTQREILNLDEDSLFMYNQLGIDIRDLEVAVKHATLNRKIREAERAEARARKAEEESRNRIRYDY